MKKYTMKVQVKWEMNQDYKTSSFIYDSKDELDKAYAEVYDFLNGLFTASKILDYIIIREERAAV